MIGRPQFSLRTAIIAITLIAWLVGVILPGGLWVTLPIGLAVLASATFLFGVRKLRSDWHSPLAARFRASIQPGLSLAVLLAFCVVYPPLWSLARQFQARDIKASALRDYVLYSMDAESLCNDGRQLMRYMEDNSISSIVMTDEHIPSSITRLHPVYIDTSDGCLTIPVGNGDDRFYLLVYAVTQPGRGNQRLSDGLWFFVGGSWRWITDAEWDSGIRN